MPAKDEALVLGGNAVRLMRGVESAPEARPQHALKNLVAPGRYAFSFDAPP
jgi:hypothetical protein